jgi:cation transport ATPase
MWLHWSDRLTIWQNFTSALITDVVGIAMTGVGQLHASVAAFICVVSEITLIFNSTRILPRWQPSTQVGRALAWLRSWNRVD